MQTAGVADATVELPNAQATRDLGARLARACRSVVVVLLSGSLGAGKTTFADGFVSALGGGTATSPTFVVAHSYPSAMPPVWHLDFYRLDASEIEELDIAQYISPHSVTIVEWPERASVAWSPDRVEVALAAVDEHRVARLRGFGAGAQAVRAAVA